MYIADDVIFKVTLFNQWSLFIHVSFLGVGFVKFTSIGGIDAKTVLEQKVVIHGKKPIVGIIGSKPIHVLSAAERKSVPELKSLFIDTGLSKEKLMKKISIGDPITRHQKLKKIGNLVSGKSMDNRVSCYALIEFLKDQ